MGDKILIGAFGLGTRMWDRREPIRFTEDPWDWRPQPGGDATIAACAQRERRAALDHLAGLLDGWCEATTVDGVPLDPHVVWRGPRLAAQGSGIRTFVATERIALAVHRPEDAMIVNVT